MNRFARIIASCFFTSVLLASPAAFADRPSMSDDRGKPLPPPPEFMTPADEEMADSRPEASAEPMAEPIAEPEMIEAPEVIVVEETGDAVEVQPGQTLGVRLLDFPRRGMNMDKVKNELGQPRQISPTVGEPPITSWEYDDRTVYFERAFVIHVVATN